MAGWAEKQRGEVGGGFAVTVAAFDGLLGGVSRRDGSLMHNVQTCVCFPSLSRPP